MIAGLCHERFDDMDVELHLTRMASGADTEAKTLGETNADVESKLADICHDPWTKVIFMNVAMCDFDPTLLQFIQGPTAETSDVKEINVGKYEGRLSSRGSSRPSYVIELSPSKKVISSIRKARKDVFLVGFKTTCGVTENEQYIAGLNLLKEASCNLVLANDTKTRMNMIITPEEARYHVTTDRHEALRQLVDMAYLRSHLTFTRSTVVDGKPVSWSDERIPATLRTVVNHCINRGGYKPFRGATVGHFACKLDDTTFLTSIRKSNFNDIEKNGLVMIKTDGPDTVLAYGAKPSVGGQSQRLIFRDHPGMDCIVHFHCPLRDGSEVPIVSQREYECGSHQCGQNTSGGLKRFGNLLAVFLDQHGPNIVFNKEIDPAEVISFIESNFDLTDKTGGPVKL